MYSFVMLLESFTVTSGWRKNKFWNNFALESDNCVYSTLKTDSLMRRHNSRWQSFISYLRINIPSRCSYPEILLLWLANWDSCSCCSNAQLHSFHSLIGCYIVFNVCVCVCSCGFDRFFCIDNCGTWTLQTCQQCQPISHVTPSRHNTT